MPKKKVGDINDAMREWAGAELDGLDVTTDEARQIVAEHHYGGLDGFAANYNTDYGKTR